MTMTSGRVAALRKTWGLSQSQLAQVSMTSVRTIRRWEGGGALPTPHDEWFLQLFVQYVRNNSLPKFLERFVGQAPRYQKAGRARQSSVQTKRFMNPATRNDTDNLSETVVGQSGFSRRRFQCEYTSQAPPRNKRAGTVQ